MRGNSLSKRLFMILLMMLARVAAPSVAAEPSPFMSVPQELDLGRRDYDAAPRSMDPAAIDRLYRIGGRLAQHTNPRTGVDYVFSVLDSTEINAYTSYGGYIYVSRGLLDFVGDDDNLLAAVLAHEMVHADSRDVANAIEDFEGLTAQLRTMADAGFVAGIDKDAFRVKFDNLLAMGLSRADEYAADAHGALYLMRAGYEPRAMITLMEHMRDAVGEHLPSQSRWLDHPSFTDRIEKLENFLDQVTVAKDKYERGLNFLARGETAKAIENMDHYLGFFPDDASAANNLGAALLLKAAGYADGWMWRPEADPPLRAAATVAGMNAPAFDTVSDYESLLIAQRVLARAGSAPGAACNTAATLMYLMRPDQARALLERPAAAGVVCAINLQGILVAATGDFKGASEYFEHAASLAPVDTAPQFNLALAYHRAGMTEQAKAAWDAFLSGAFDVPDWWRDAAQAFRDELGSE